jgi:hypothetical protein
MQLRIGIDISIVPKGERIINSIRGDVCGDASGDEPVTFAGYTEGTLNDEPFH